MRFLRDISHAKERIAQRPAPFLMVTTVVLLFTLFLSIASPGVATSAEAESSSSIEASVETGEQARAGSTDCVMSADEYENGVTAANMVLLVSFSDTADAMLDAYNAEYFYQSSNPLGINTNWQYLMWMIDGLKQSYLSRTWRDYLYEISQGQCNVKSYFPQTQADGKVAHITLDRPASDYKDNDGLLVGDIARKFNEQFASYETSKTDKNGDGFIDNLMIVPMSKDVFTSHKASLGETLSFGSGTGGKVKESITVVEGPLTLTDAGVGTFGFSESVAVHEYLHTLGARDYYRDGIEGDPVSYWDVMARGAVYSWPLAFTREQVGWTNIPEVDLKNLDETYTLFAPSQSDAKAGVSNPSKPQALKIKTSLSSSEYFIVEYRQKNTESLMGYDRYIGASGLIAYRVNETHATMGNIRGDDYVYVFRPGETGLKSSAGDVDSAAIAAGSYVSQNGKTLKQSIGSTDLNAKFTDNTLFFENGLNSGIKIDAVSQTDGSITFKISTADYAQADMWEPLSNQDGSTPFGSWSSPSVQAASDESNPYMLTGNGSLTNPLWAVWKHDGSNWQQLGTKPNDLRNARLAVVEGKPYLLGVSLSDQKQLVLRTLTSGQWKTVAATTLKDKIWSTDLRVIGGKLYAFGGAEGDCRVFILEGTALKQYGSELPVASAYQVSLSDCGGQLLLVSNDSAVAKTNAYCWNGSTWSSLLIKSSASSVIKSVTKDGKTYVYTLSNDGTGNGAQLAILSSPTTIARTVKLAELGDATSDTSICAGKNNLYLAKSTSTGVKVYSLPYSAASSGDISQLAQLGGTVFSNASSMDVIAVGDTAYCMLGDWSSSSVAVRYHKLREGDSAEPLDPSQGGAIQPSLTPIENASVQVGSQTYTGKPLTPKPTVKLGSTVLKEGTDYTLFYSDNTNVGTAKITITGKGDYTGTKVVKFEIVATTSGGNAGATNPGTGSNGGSNNGSGSSGGASAQVPTKAPPVTGVWKKTAGKWWFSYDTKTKASQKKSWPTNEWVVIKGKRYHFDSKGYMHAHWQKMNNSWYYFGSDGAMKTGWQKVKRAWYYLASNGIMQTGNKNIAGKWYYLNPSSGAMKTGWNKESNTWYYYTSSGAMAYGWVKVDGKWYYLDPSKGAMKTKWLTLQGKTYFLYPQTGEMLTGWVKINSTWYYFNKSGVMQKNRWVGNYYVESDGAMATNKWIGSYHVNAQGKWDGTKR